ncbi:transcriptional regulator [Gracilibacillus oryzae]|uniref:GTP cyclohydrolase 1 type 2 homolog n=1 Tax=Gracilibacillus oryzae TaxID=1672701 RepID=A0A7C8L2Q6_9BACI|nr:Nif3-like dinuclear metal center hexameric protein [Gracilibacillus oryzae]KAB8131000.1 transcriptional regulator [Gracilibacillus oryzae]
MDLNIQDIISVLINPIQEIDDTVDILHYGNSNKTVKKIAVSFMPTHEIIERCAQLDVDLLITHEGLFYSHTDNHIAIENAVAWKKQKLIKESGLAIFRFHDYMHRYQPDPIMQGLLTLLKWDQHVKEHNTYSTVVELPTMSVEQIMTYLKEMLNISYVRFAGDLSTQCTKVGLLVGYRGGISHSIPLFEEEQVDLVIYGEGPEWETPEYVRDAISQGVNRSIIMLGHLESEEAGMRYLAEQLSNQFPDIAVKFMATGSQIKVN